MPQQKEVNIVKSSWYNREPAKWYIIAQNNLEPGDKIWKSFGGEFDGNKGYLVISHKRLLFVRERGLWRKIYDIILNLPIDNVGKVSHEGRNRFGLIEADSKKHIMDTWGVRSSIVEKSIEEAMGKM
jgi:hypothetical protein